MRDARLEAGRLQRMRHARARLEIVVVCIEAVLRLLPVRLEIGVWGGKKTKGLCRDELIIISQDM